MRSDFVRWMSTAAVACGAVACSGAINANDAAVDGDARVSVDSPGDVSAGDAGSDVVVATDVPASIDATADAGMEPPLVQVTFTAGSASPMNPERGWYEGGGINLRSTDSYTNIRADGFTLAYAPLRLDQFRGGPISASALAQISASFARVRAAHIKLVMRIVYNDPSNYPCTDPSPTGECADAPESVVLNHITQLTPILTANADVIAVLQLGIIGLWGEGHGSTNGIDQSAPRQRIVRALLAALPASRDIQMRTPMTKAALGYATPLDASHAFDGSDQARIGHHNDCFLASPDDYGTYDTPVATWENYVAVDGLFTPVGGETCGVNAPRTSCASAVSEMNRLHWSFLNRAYEPNVIDGWRTMNPPCYGEIERRLGYRIALLDVSHSERVRPGGVLTLRVHLRNDGFAAMYNARHVYAVLDGAGGRHTARFDAVDPRTWASGTEATFESRFRIPAGTAAGDYRIALWLPDEATALRDVADYAVQLANDGIWRSTEGDNVVTATFHVDASATGSMDPSATDFVEIH